MKRLKLWWLKQRAAYHFKSWHLHIADLDCGLHMALTLRGYELTYHARKFNDLMVRIKELDPLAPNIKLEGNFGEDE